MATLYERWGKPLLTQSMAGEVQALANGRKVFVLPSGSYSGFAQRPVGILAAHVGTGKIEYKTGVYYRIPAGVSVLTSRTDMQVDYFEGWPFHCSAFVPCDASGLYSGPGYPAPGSQAPLENMCWHPGEADFCPIPAGWGQVAKREHQSGTDFWGNQCRILCGRRLSRYLKPFLDSTNAAIIGINPDEPVAGLTTTERAVCWYSSYGYPTDYGNIYSLYICLAFYDDTHAYFMVFGNYPRSTPGGVVSTKVGGYVSLTPYKWDDTWNGAFGPFDVTLTDEVANTGVHRFSLHDRMVPYPVGAWLMGQTGIGHGNLSGDITGVPPDPDHQVLSLHADSPYQIEAATLTKTQITATFGTNPDYPQDAVRWGKLLTSWPRTSGGSGYVEAQHNNGTTWRQDFSGYTSPPYGPLFLYLTDISGTGREPLVGWPYMSLVPTASHHPLGQNWYRNDNGFGY